MREGRELAWETVVVQGHVGMTLGLSVLVQPSLLLVVFWAALLWPQEGGVLQVQWARQWLLWGSALAVWGPLWHQRGFLP